MVFMLLHIRSLFVFFALLIGFFLPPLFDVMLALLLFPFTFGGKDMSCSNHRLYDLMIVRCTYMIEQDWCFFLSLLLCLIVLFPQPTL